MNKAIIFDSGTLISLAMAGLILELKKLRNNFDGKFIVTKQVEEEVINTPLTIKRFELDALKIKSLLDEKILEGPESLNIKNEDILKESERIKNEVNSMFYARGKAIKLIDDGEASCLALNKILINKRYKTAIAIDERTTRILGEKPDNLKKLMENKLKLKIDVKRQFSDEFKSFIFLRSTELMYVAYKKGLVDLKGPKVLDAILYGLKFKGAAISFEEIEEIKKMN